MVDKRFLSKYEYNYLCNDYALNVLQIGNCLLHFDLSDRNIV